MKIRLYIITFFCFLLSSAFPQINYWVATTGSNSNNGTQANPWATIEYAVNNVANPTTATIIINVANGTYTLSNDEIYIDRSFTNLTILGGTTEGTIVQATSDTSLSNSRVFYITSGENITIKNMTIQYGKATSSGGGGIFNKGNLTIDFCKITKNICTANGVGAGVGNEGGNLVIKNSTISFNKAYNVSQPCYGGGIGLTNGTVEISNSTISYNQSVSGGGIMIILNSNYTTSDVQFTMENSTVSENKSYLYGGAIRVDNYFTTPLNIISNINSSTIFKNHSEGDGGGIFLSNQTDVNIKNTILAGNTAGPSFTSNDLKGLNSNYIIASGDYNLIQTNINVTINGSVDNNIYNQSANCLTLADNNTTNGTQTCRTQTGSPAINAIPGGNGAPLQDQRGAERNGNYDIGAYEWWTDDGALPVELTSFTSQLKNNKVILNWETATELNNYGFDIERRVGSIQSSVGNYEEIGFVHGNGNSNSPKNYSFEDGTVTTGKYSYRLKQIDTDGQFEYSNTIEVDLGSPDKFYLSQNFPNPFNPSTVINYQLPVASQVTLKIFDIVGNEVASLVDEYKNAGSYEVEFNVGWDSSPALASGIYFYGIAIHSDKIQAGDPSSGSGQSFVETKKMILLK